jgi:DNA polymerase-4
MPVMCRDCDAEVVGRICPVCGSARQVGHPELFSLEIGHVDCDAFYASVEKRDRPELRDRPVIVGGGARGVVTTCCYIARLSGVRSAMPMFKAKALCPQAVIIPPDMAKYVAVSRQIRAMMESLTPLVQALSIDEAVLDLAGTARLHGAPPAVVLNRFARRVEAEVGVTVSIGLARNRLLAKLAAERGKPRGFFALGSEAAAVLAPEPVGLLPGIGPAQVKRLGALGITTLGQLGEMDVATALRRLGAEGPALAARARGEDVRAVSPEHETKSISAETTLATDEVGRAALEAVLWRLAERVAERLKDQKYAAAGITLKLKTADFQTRTRAARLANPTQLPELLFEAAVPLLAGALGPRFRLVGLAASTLAPGAGADRGDLADTTTARRATLQTAIDNLRGRYGSAAVQRGRGLPKTSRTP